MSLKGMARDLPVSAQRTTRESAEASYSSAAEGWATGSTWVTVMWLERAA